ncbi:MAG: hypothetical protein AAF882_20835, partial [Pseudomonadota bacterium]
MEAGLIAVSYQRVRHDVHSSLRCVLEPFDLSAISDEGIRREYAFLQKRADATIRAVQQAYGQGRAPIAFRFVDEKRFNARVGKEAGTYGIEMNAAVPLFNLILFSRLLTDPRLFPHLPTSGRLESDYTLPAVVDPSDFSKRSDWKIELTGPRAFAAGTLADICSSFVVFHEIGHVLCGHVEGAEALEGC